MEEGKERPEGREPRPTDIPVGYVTRDTHYLTTLSREKKAREQIEREREAGRRILH